jgi:tetratricopeptide (TPR) repeat protein
LRADEDIMPLIYARLVENERPDVLVLDDFGLVFNRYEGRVLTDHVIATTSELNAYRDQIRRLGRGAGERPVFYLAPETAPGLELSPVGILYQEERPGVPLHAVEFARLYRGILALRPADVRNFAGRTVCGRYHLAQAALLARAGDALGARQALGWARGFAEANNLLLAALHVEANRQGQFDLGQECLAERLRLVPSGRRQAWRDHHGSRVEYITQHTPENQPAVEAELRGLLVADPDYSEARLKLGAIVFERDYSGAPRQLEEALRLGYNPAWCLCLLGVCRIGHGEVDAGLGLMRKAISQSGRDVGVVRNLAMMLDATGHPDEARGAWLKVLELAPDDPAAHRALKR